MQRLAAIIGLVLLVFTVSGAHRTFAATDTCPMNSGTMQMMGDASGVEQQDNGCCDSHEAGKSAIHGACSVPCIVLADQTHIVATFSAETLLPPIATLGEGLHATPLKRPPKFLL